MSQARLCIGDPDAYASEMIKLINDKEFRRVKLAAVHNIYKDCQFYY
jgi:hypothetical protein